MKSLFAIACFGCLAFALSAQPSQEVAPSTSDAVALEITDLFGSTISVSTLQIENFFDSLLVGTIQGCGIPEPDLGTYSAQELFLTWPAVPGATKYHISYLDLHSGAIQSLMLPPDPNDTYKITGIPDGLYAFSIQTVCSSGRSYLGIIIAEKDIMLTIDDSMNCRCKKKQLEGIPVYAGDLLPANSRMELHVPSEEAEIIIHTVTGAQEADGTPVTINPNCGDDPVILGNIVYPVTDNEGVIHFSAGVLNYWLDSDDGSILRFDCLNPPTNNGSPNGKNAASFFSTKLSPNPATDRVLLEIQLQKADQLKVSVYNQQGQLLKQLEDQRVLNKGYFSQHYSIGHLPAGYYFCRIQLNDQTQVLKLVKQ